MNKTKFAYFMKMKKKAPLGGSGRDSPIIDDFFEEFLKADPTEAQFCAMLTGCLASTVHLYILWKN